MKYLIYARVSPKGSSWTGGETSIPVQIQECKDYSRRQDPSAEFVVMEDKLFSGKNTKRPSMKKIVDQIMDNSGEWDCLVVYHLDRFTRSLVDGIPLFEALRVSGKGFISVRQNIDLFSAGGRAMLYMLLVFAQFEREMNSERTKSKMVSIAQGGGIPYGHPPFGYKREKDTNTLALDPGNAEIVQAIFHKYINGISVDKLYAEFVGKIKSKQNITNILRNKIYTGCILYDGQEYPGAHEPLISLSIWEKAIARLPGKRSSPRMASRKYDYLLSGIIKCYCGRHMTPYSFLKKGRRFAYYKCTDPLCKNAINAEKIDNAFLDEIKTMDVNDEAIRIMLDEYSKIRAEIMAQKEPQLQEINKELSLLNEKQSKIQQAFLSGLGTQENKSFWNNSLSDVNKEINELQDKKEDDRTFLRVLLPRR